ncbi:flagellar biosynthesis protein FlhF [Helicobacter saguini]|uniref:Flagellar biosynthesis protein FlhF n=1 Tax=Helicobacter saguini TaxID=1548018 RepID=A0A347VRM2_9HELI|nr:flagellar biosynthesis protein FlhF [Helicobacter saguini]MWV66479.1 flagellar biosynthesis protein FlhF [Helicobacter saguini]MWV68829.1 flagellar biosynthesis protein FlhF [Helicobacter saguini]MWV71616.1 flagellar biosynthesis protein FlhF [Helicobacter saguini]TLD94421.1 flagellar biosynthesis protein FlhF [Helicobacter saguini]
MKLFTYSGETPTDAMRKAQDAHGDDALIVDNKEIRKKTLNEPGLYEIVVAVDDSKVIESQNETIAPKNSIQQRLDDIAQRELERKRAQKLNNGFDENTARQLTKAVQQIKELSNDIDGDDIKIDFSPNARRMQSQAQIKSRQAYPSNTPNTPMVQQASNTLDILNRRVDSKLQERANAKGESVEELRGIKQELDKLNDKLKLIQNMVWEDRGPKSEGINIPHEFAEIYRIAKSSGICKEHLDSIMSLSLELMPLKMRENSLTIKRYFREVLRKMIYCRPESKDMTKKIIMLVGPTGVGKTTALAKLAARFSLEKKAKVGIITLDSYRIGALEQLEWYAERMRISIQMVMAPEDFVKALDSLRYCDYILVDTAGRSQNDSEKIAQIKKYLQGDYKINTSLVMSATTKYEDLRDIYDAFGILNLDTLIFSKLDESRGLGNIFSLAYETKKPISYFSVGQEVPTDLVVATNEALVDWLLDGFTNPNK